MKFHRTIFKSALMALTLALSACQEPQLASVGQPAPQLTVTTPDGTTTQLADFQGKVVFVNFWTSGCGPCLAEMPEIDAVYQSLQSKGFEIFAVNLGQEPNIIQNVARRLDLSYPLLSDRLRIASNRFGVTATPTSFLVDRNGVLSEIIYGPLTRHQLEQRVAGIL